MARLFILSFVALFLTSCQSYDSVRVTPESLISSSSEKVAFGLVDESSINSIYSWAEGDLPTSATISCNKPEESLCVHAQEIMDDLGIPYTSTRNAGGGDNVDLIYERVTSRDCSAKGFGCSVSVNSVQMVTNNAQFTNPVLSAPQDAETAVQRLRRYMSK